MLQHLHFPVVEDPVRLVSLEVLVSLEIISLYIIFLYISSLLYHRRHHHEHQRRHGGEGRHGRLWEGQLDDGDCKTFYILHFTFYIK